jgi:hypothetical protein
MTNRFIHSRNIDSPNDSVSALNTKSDRKSPNRNLDEQLFPNTTIQVLGAKFGGVPLEPRTLHSIVGNLLSTKMGLFKSYTKLYKWNNNFLGWQHAVLRIPTLHVR